MSIIPTTVPTGAIRYNTDSNKMECFNGTKWMQVAVSSPDLNGGARGLIISGRIASGNPTNVIEYITITTAGNSIDFGDNTQASEACFNGTAASNTRAIRFGGYPGGHVNVIEYVTFAQLGNAVDFGDMTYTSRGGGSCSNATRGIAAGGLNPTHQNVINYITIATTGDAIDFGDLTVTRDSCSGGANSYRGLFIGASPGDTSVDTIMIASTGNAQDWGDMYPDYSDGSFGSGTAANTTRSLRLGGHLRPSPYPTTTEITEYSFLTAGFVQAFGDLTDSSRSVGGMSNCVRAVAAMGTDEESPSAINVIDYSLFATGGLAVDFGDLTLAHYEFATASNAHGGL